MFDADAFKKRDHRQFDFVIDKYAYLVRHVVRSFALNRDHADDLAQMVWVQVYQRAQSFAERGSIEAWIHRIATNVCLTDFRSTKMKIDKEQKLAEEGGGSDLAGWRPEDPSVSVERAERLEAIHRALAELPERQHETVVLRLVENRSPSETARIMGVTPPTVRSNLRHALKKLKELMEDPGDAMSRYRPAD